MSDNLIIREDGIGRLIRGVDALEIKLQNGGTSRWVRFNPRDQKSVNANGEYHAKDDGVDGYRTITVNVPTRTKSQEPGRDQEIFNPDTGTGYYTDDDGFLHEELLPTEIRIMHVPDKTTYQDDEPIDLEGIMVQAYRDGEVWTSAQYPDGYIPVHELTYTVGEKENGEISDLTTSFPQPIRCYKASDYERVQFHIKTTRSRYETGGLRASDELTVEFYDFPEDASFFLLKYIIDTVPENNFYNIDFILIIATPAHATNEKYKTKYVKKEYVYEESGHISTRTYRDEYESQIRGVSTKVHGKTSKTNYGGLYPNVIQLKAEEPEFDSNIPISYELYNPSFNSEDIGRTGWTMVYGEIVDFSGVTILWNRPKDGKALSDSFNVLWEAAP